MKTRTEKFKASTQYNDWFGTIALDRADLKGVYNKFRHLLEENESIIGINVYSHINSEVNAILKIDVSIYKGQIEIDEFGYRKSKAYPRVKEHVQEMTTEEFLKLFKRINLKFS